MLPAPGPTAAQSDPAAAQCPPGPAHKFVSCRHAGRAPAAQPSAPSNAVIPPDGTPATPPPAREQPADAAPATRKSPAGWDLPVPPVLLVRKYSLTVSYSLLTGSVKLFLNFLKK